MTPVRFRRYLDDIGADWAKCAAMQRLLAGTLACLVAVTSASCTQLSETVQNNPKAVLGSLVGATLGGALLGGFVGNRLDARDKKMAAQAAQKAFESSQSGQASVWNNPD